MFRTVAALLLGLSLALPAGAEQPRMVTWDDLMPAERPLDSPFLEYTEDQREDFAYVMRVQTDLEQGFITADSDDYKRAMKVKDDMIASGIDFEAMSAASRALIAEVDRRGAEVVRDLDGLVVRMPGYALPLESSDGGITEFLLVPYVGACIHVPPPPPNQMVFVKLADAYQVKSLYDPVWITGRMKVEPASRALSYVDGSADVATGYTIEGISIEPYK